MYTCEDCEKRVWEDDLAEGFEADVVTRAIKEELCCDCFLTHSFFNVLGDREPHGEGAMI